MKQLYNYIASADDKYPLFRTKMAFMGGYCVSFIACVLEYGRAHRLGSSLNSTGLQCIKYVLTGTSAAVCHSSVSFISAKATGRSDSWVNHALGGAASGLVCTWQCTIIFYLNEKISVKGMMDIIFRTTTNMTYILLLMSKCLFD
ncbi:unnamed protein product [Schistosoma bovis]|nr:unnamed protein product [Schistosoma bovis]CAH8671866.1 unnamed protein product [Schistosoma bovis]